MGIIAERELFIRKSLHVRRMAARAEKFGSKQAKLGSLWVVYGLKSTFNCLPVWQYQDGHV